MGYANHSGLVERIERLYVDHGHMPYPGARQEPVNAMQHALQCAQLAEWAEADAALVAAAFLHDIGHFVARSLATLSDQSDDRHELLAVGWLAEGFDAAVTEPIRLHVEAKRYLVRTDPDYRVRLSPASLHTLALQGGPMTDAELEVFEDHAHAHAALRLRRWDDLAKDPAKRTPPLDYYLALLDDLEDRAVLHARLDVGAPSIA